MHIVVLVTAKDKKEAKKIALALLKARLAACVNISGRIDSVFTWEGKIDTSAEVLLFIKSRKEKFAGIAKLVRSLHSYSVPEIIALPVIKGQANYLRWINAAVRNPR